MELMGQVPVVCACMGSVAGSAQSRNHFPFLINDQRNQPDVCCWPPVVERALASRRKNELGGSQIHAQLSGAVDNEVASEEEAFLTIKKFLSYLPQNVWQMPPIVASSDPIDRRDENLLSVIPRNRREMYEIGDIISAIVDRESS